MALSVLLEIGCYPLSFLIQHAEWVSALVPARLSHTQRVEQKQGAIEHKPANQPTL